MILTKSSLVGIDRNSATYPKSYNMNKIIAISRENGHIIYPSAPGGIRAINPIYGISSEFMRKFDSGGLTEKAIFDKKEKKKNKGKTWVHNEKDEATLDAVSISTILGASGYRNHPMSQVVAIENFASGSYGSKNLETFSGYVPNYLKSTVKADGARLDVVKLGYLTTTNEKCSGMVFRYYTQESFVKAELLKDNLVLAFGESKIIGNRDEPLRSSPDVDDINKKISQKLPAVLASEVKNEFQNYLSGNIGLGTLLSRVHSELKSGEAVLNSSTRAKIFSDIKKLLKAFNDGAYMFGHNLNTVSLGIFAHDKSFSSKKDQIKFAEVMYETEKQLYKLQKAQEEQGQSKKAANA